MNLIENQPIVFNLSDDDCRCENIIYKQLVDDGDTSQFQFGVDYCATASNIITNGAFNNSSNWTTIGYSIASNQACSTSGGNAIIWQTGILTDGSYYAVEFTVDSIASDCTLYVQFGNQNQVAEITSTGEKKVFGFAWDDGQGSVVSDALIFVSTNSDLCISNVRMYEVSLNYGVMVRDWNNQPAEVLWLSDYIVNYAANNVSTGWGIESDYFELSDTGICTVKVDWGALEIQTAGCYTIDLLDQCQQTEITADLCESGDWTVNTYGVVTLNQFGSTISDTITCIYEAEGNATAFVTMSSDTIALSSGTRYRITYTVTGSGFEAYPVLGSNEGTHRTASGTYTDTITADGSNIYWWLGSDGGAFDITISNIYIHVADDLLVTQAESVTLQLGNYTCGTLLLSASGDDDVFGMAFSDSSFLPAIRVEAQLDRTQFKYDRRVQENSVARFRNTYFQRYRDQRLYIQPVAQYVHEFLSLLAGFDHFYIDTDEYVISPDQEYVVNYDGSDFVGSVSIDVRRKEELVRNQVCGAEGAGNAPPPVFLVDEATGTFILQSEDANSDLLAENQ